LSFELQLDKPSRLSAATTARVRTTRPGLQKLFFLVRFELVDKDIVKLFPAKLLW
jgi:hypothetical protein